MDKDHWNRLFVWMQSKGLNLDLNPLPIQFKNGMGNLNYKVFLSGSKKF